MWFLHCMWLIRMGLLWKCRDMFSALQKKDLVLLDPGVQGQDGHTARTAAPLIPQTLCHHLRIVNSVVMFPWSGMTLCFNTSLRAFHQRSFYTFKYGFLFQSPWLWKKKITSLKKNCALFTLLCNTAIFLITVTSFFSSVSTGSNIYTN